MILCKAEDGIREKEGKSQSSDNNNNKANNKTMTREEATQQQCGVYLYKKSARDPFRLYAGVDYKEGEILFDKLHEIVVSVIDTNKNEWNPWHDYVLDPVYYLDGEGLPLYLDNNFTHDIFVPGIRKLVKCSSLNPKPNVGPVIDEEDTRACNSGNGHCQASVPTSGGGEDYVSAGSFTNNYNPLIQETYRYINAGEEIHFDCANGAKDGAETKKNGKNNEESIPTLEWLHDNAICIDNLEVRLSRIPGIGKGVFSKKDIKGGETVTVSPVIHINRADLDIVEQQYNVDQVIPVVRDHGIEYTGKVVGKQLLLNYCFGTSDSNVLLLPYGPGVNFINHNRESPNVKIEWSVEMSSSLSRMDLSAHDLLAEEVVSDGYDQLILKYVATRDIKEGEEIYLDYGDEWTDDWEKHRTKIQTTEREGIKKQYTSATEYSHQVMHDKKGGDNYFFKTNAEQRKHPYPNNLRVACAYSPIISDEYDVGAIDDQTLIEEGPSSVIEWTNDNDDCLRPCDIEERVVVGDKVFYNVVVHPVQTAVPLDDFCGSNKEVPTGGRKVRRVPHEAIVLIDKPYTKNQYRKDAFRHEIGIPVGLYPKGWMIADVNYDATREGGFIVTPPPKPGEIQPVRFRDGGEVVPNGYRIGLDQKVSHNLRDYMDLMGFTDIARHVTAYGNGVVKGTNLHFIKDDVKWLLQSTSKKFTSNLHWLSPLNGAAQDHFLQALSVAGFDNVLESIGRYFDMTSVTCYQLSFLLVSNSLTGFLHTDFSDNDADAFNVLIPLQLVNGSGPELDLVTYYPRQQIGRYKYEYDVGIMVGDGTVHATSAIDYRAQHDQMRIMASVYVADINYTNADWLAEEVTQVYPPDGKTLLDWAGRHWRKNDPSVKLPKPKDGHILFRNKTS